MTEEEKTEEYANEKCKECYMCSYSECENPYEECEKRQCRIQSYLAGLHEGQPKWHKVADGDLPKEPKRYLCQIKYNVGGAITYECSDYDVEYNSWTDSYGDVIAWKEIVLLKESE